jgi:LuxR family transcriptional regulator, quorum-sensing system regulator BjaR1
VQPETAFAVVGTIESSDTLGAITAALKNFGAAFGYDRFVLFSTSVTQDEAIDRIYWIEGDWFDDGTAVDAETYVRRCPVNRHVFTADAPFFWTKTGSGANELYNVVGHPRGRGVHGLQVPVFGPSGLEGAASLGGTRIDATREATLAMTMVGAAALRSVKRLVQPPTEVRPGVLSEREREVLRWTAVGRRQIDIAATLGLSQRTIENHLRRIRVRLGAKTTAEAVHIAMR